MATSKNIQVYLKKHGPASAAEIGRVLGMTKANIQYHLQKLLEEGHVVVHAKPGKQVRGRPVHIYRLAFDLQPSNLVELVRALFELGLKDHIGQAERAAYYQRLASMLFPDHAVQPALTQSLNAAVARLNQHQYQARWEAHHNGPCLMFRSCPYAAVLEHCPALCELDTTILAYLLGRPVQQDARIEPGDPTSACKFSLHSDSQSLT